MVPVGAQKEVPTTPTDLIADSEFSAAGAKSAASKSSLKGNLISGAPGIWGDRGDRGDDSDGAPFGAACEVWSPTETRNPPAQSHLSNAPDFIFNIIAVKYPAKQLSRRVQLYRFSKGFTQPQDPFDLSTLKEFFRNVGRATRRMDAGGMVQSDPVLTSLPLALLESIGKTANKPPVSSYTNLFKQQSISASSRPQVVESANQSIDMEMYNNMSYIDLIRIIRDCEEVAKISRGGTNEDDADNEGITDKDVNGNLNAGMSSIVIEVEVVFVSNNSMDAVNIKISPTDNVEQIMSKICDAWPLMSDPHLESKCRDALAQERFAMSINNEFTVCQRLVLHLEQLLIQEKNKNIRLESVVNDKGNFLTCTLSYDHRTIVLCCVEDLQHITPPPPHTHTLLCKSK